jgi:hypothetical protein
VLVAAVDERRDHMARLLTAASEARPGNASLTVFSCPVQPRPSVMLGGNTAEHQLFNVAIEAAADNARQLRVRCQQWLQAMGVRSAVVEDLTLAVYEASANAVKHACDPDRPTPTASSPTYPTGSALRPGRLGLRLENPFGRVFLQTLTMVSEFEANLGHLRTREGLAKARRQGKLRGKQPKLPPSAARTIRRRYAEGEVSLADLAEEYSVGRSTVHRIIHRLELDSLAP